MPKKTAKRFKYQTKLALWALGTIAFLLLLSYLVNLVQNFYSPLSTTADKRDYLWDKNSNINLSIKTDRISILSYNPIDKKILIISVPDETYIQVPGGFGTWSAKSIYGLGESEENLSGNYLLQKSLASFLAIPVDAFIEFDGDLLGNMRNPLKYPYLYSKLKTNLTPFELLNLALGIKSVRFDKVHELDFAQILDEDQLPDQTKILVADPTKIDAISNKLAESKIISEQLTIGVYNATRYPGLALKAARIITNMGGNVIVTANISFQKTSMVQAEEDSFTSRKLGQIFAPNCLQSLKCSIIDHDFRAAVNVILGEDFYQRY